MNMGKFPGKPSKIVNRKRVKASKCSPSQENDSVKAAENIYFGLAVFNEAFGSEQVTTDFLGFTAQEARAAVIYAKKKQREVIAEYDANGLHISLKDHFERELAHTKVNVVSSSRQANGVRRTRKQHSVDSGDKSNSSRDLSLPKKLHSARSPPVTTNLKNKAAKKLLQKAKKSSTYISPVPIDNSQQEKVNGAVRKFVLPSRSVHSSRVIKPNKRFIEAEEVLSDVSVSRSPGVQLKKPRLIVSPPDPDKSDKDSTTVRNIFGQTKKVNVNCDKTELLSGYNSSDCSNQSLSPHNSSQENSLIVEGKRRWKPSYKVQLKLRELNVFGAGTNRFPSKRTQASSSDSTRSVHSASDKELGSTSTDSSECGRLAKPLSNEVKSDWSGPKLNSSGKVILRKARLKLNSQTTSGTEGPFSVNLNSGNSIPGTVVCGVCGAVRFYRFVKQARKFGIFSCESCRKFISKMMKRQACSKAGSLPVLECHKGAGMCSVPPIVRSQQWKPGRGTQLRCSYKARCPACWLKMCLRSFKMPDTLRENMALMLPPEMRQGLEKLPINHLCMRFENSPSLMQTRPLELDKASRIPVLEPSGLRSGFFNSNGNGLSAFSPVTSLKRDKQKDHDKNKRGKRLHSNKLLKKASKKLGKSKDNPDSSMERLRKKKNSGVKVRKKNGQKSDSSTPGSDATRRQRLDLKGPRVKHVCRSASIVLGQPQATFPLDKVKVERTEPKAVQDPIKVANKSSCCAGCTGPDSERSCQSHSHGEVNKSVRSTAGGDADSGEATEVARPQSSTDVASSSQDEEPVVAPVSYRKSSKPSSLPSVTSAPASTTMSVVRTLPVLGKRAVPEPQNLVSIDFWESYDPEEVCNTGFGLIGSEPFHVRAMCFLCGSAGHEKLIHCASCCEPYHRFCLEDGLRDTSLMSDGKNDEWRYNWVCQRCTVCHACGRGLGQQLSCQRCHRTYHTECMGADRLSSRLHSPDRPWVCSTCLRCKSCGVADVTLFVGNLPLCKACFKLRQKGNYCPLCQRCYEDDDYDTKMMECGQCRCWVHAKCEGLSDEKYQVLSYLPDSVEFVCRMCCVIPPAPWWLAVEEELKAGYLSVLKSLSKNRKACAMLKWSPKKQCLCRPAIVSKRLDFQEISDREAETDEAVVPEISSTTDTSHLVTTTVPEIVIVDGSLPDSNVAPNVNRQLKAKFNLKDCSVRVENCVLKSNSKLPLSVKIEDTDPGFSPDSTFSECSSKSPAKVQVASMATPASDSGIGSTDDELKPNCIEEEQEDTKDDVRRFSPSQLLELAFRSNAEKCPELVCDTTDNDVKECFCLDQHTLAKPSPTLLSIKKKVNGNEYSSLLQFHQEMEQMVVRAQCSDLLETYHHTLKEIFPWFDPKYARVSSSWKDGRPSHEEASALMSIKIEQDSPHDEEQSTEYTHVMGSCGKSEASSGNTSDYLSQQTLDYYYSGFTVQDMRTCILCKGLGDGLPVEEGRLLYCGQNEWVHANCALWSAEVFEEIDGSLQNVHSAVSRGRMIRCRACGKKGASVGCCARNCNETFHFPCARRIGCCFMDDKTVFCAAHLLEAAGKQLHLDLEFDIRRPIYVELDRKKKKYAESKQVKFMIGSLSVENLGEFVRASDHSDIIVPANFQCTRLYWSSVEPWRIVRYFVRTTVETADPPLVLDLGRNLTVDHTQEQRLVKQKLDEVSRWHQQLISSEHGHLFPDLQSQEEKVARQVLDHLLDTVCSKDVDDSCLSDPQTTTDLLPPELKDAIFEDLPHDLLDGISMQDIFPKLMSYEDLAAMDMKSDVDGMLECDVKQEPAMSEQSDLWFDSKEHVQDFVEDLFQNVVQKSSVRELKRSKSEVIPQPVSRKNHQRSCSLTWSCKLDGTNKRRKGTRGEGASSLVMVVDSERAHMLQELRLPDGVLVALESSRRRKEEGKENKCLVWHGRSQPRILQLDGAGDSSSSSGSEGGSSPRQVDDDLDSFKTFNNATTMCEEEPVRCDRCHRTYRTRSSFERHLPTCSSDFILSTSESDSENTRSSEEEGSKKPKFPLAVGSRQSSRSPSPEPSESKAVPVPSPAVSPQPHSKAAQSSHRGHAMNSRSRGRPTSRTVSQRTSRKECATPVMNVSQPAVIMQQVASPNMVPAFVEAFQQQTGQSLQYIATIDAHKAPYLTTAPVPGTFQLQAPPESFVGGISMLPGVQLAAPQPAVIGTLIPPPATIQCVAAEQVVLGSTPAIEMFTDQTGGMFLASQPMYYGLETIVSNTVMSSSQFVSAAMPGMMAASSSFSATTTQVFQASKLVEPIVDVPSSFVIMNPHATQIAPETAITRTDMIACTSSSVPVIPQPQAPPMQNLPWSYTDYNNSEPFIPSGACNVPTPPPPPPPAPVSSPPTVVPPPPVLVSVPPPPAPSPVLPKPVPATEPVPLTSASPHVTNKKAVKAMEVPTRTINRVFPLKVNSALDTTQPKPKINKEVISEQSTNNKTVRAPENRVTIIPITSNKNENNHNNNKQPNSLKLVFQKQAQDGYYKISNQKPNQATLSVRAAMKLKPRVTEKQKEEMNGKVPPFQEKNVLGGNTAPNITYEVHSQDGFKFSSSSISEVWQKVFEAVQEAREIHKMPRLPENPFGAASAGLQMLGFRHNGLRYLVEQLPGVGRCIKYKPRYHKLRPPCPEEDIDALPLENVSGCARCEPFKRRSQYDMFSWLASRHRQPPKFIVASDELSGNRRATSSNLPMAMRFRHLKETSKEAVGVYRSNIHGRGLFCLRDIEAGEMVIEYAGEVIRSMLTDKREKYYESKDIGCYMFRIDDQLVVDATMRGNAARFINHSCEPNCYSRVVDILGKKHILIFALRRIPQGEELTYDYKFPFEDVKIPCTCGSRKCRKYLN